MSELLDNSRDIRQDKAVNIFIDNVKNGGKGGAFEFPTGFGKTTCAVKIIGKLKPGNLVHVVVPTQELKVQWEKVVSGKFLNVHIYVVNTYVQIKRKCDLLILDEAHRYSNQSALVFNKVLTVCEFEMVLALSATYTKEQLNFLEIRKLGLLDVITVKEAQQNNWISKGIVYNLEVSLTASEQEEYNKYTKILNSYQPYLEGINPFTALKDKEAFERHCNETGLSVKEMTVKVVNFNKLTAARKALLYGARLKILIINPILERVKQQGILFSETIKFAKEVSDIVNKETNFKAVLYHSKLPDKQKTNAIVQIHTKAADLLVTAKALDEGLNVPTLKLGIIASGTSTDRQQKQREGRISRYVKDSNYILINLYCRDTVEYGWLKKRQRDTTSVRWIKEVNEIDVNNDDTNFI